MGPQRASESFKGGHLNPRAAFLRCVMALGSSAMAALLAACTPGSTAEHPGGGGEAVQEASGEETRRAPDPEPDPAPEASEDEPRLDPSAYYDPPTVDASPPKTFTRSRSAPDFPDVTLTTHEGKEVNFYQDLIKGKIVVINFMYATCKET